MKCPMCNGGFTIHGYDCPYCLVTRNVAPRTNEEWIRTATTEQLAEWLAQRDCDDLPVDATEVKEILKKEWVEWLKGKHE